MFGLGLGEILIILLIALIFLGPKKLPELAKGLGVAIREFQKASRDFRQEVMKEEPTQTANFERVEAPKEIIPETVVDSKKQESINQPS